MELTHYIGKEMEDKIKFYVVLSFASFFAHLISSVVEVKKKCMHMLGQIKAKVSFCYGNVFCLLHHIESRTWLVSYRSQ